MSSFDILEADSCFLNHLPAAPGLFFKWGLSRPMDVAGKSSVFRHSKYLDAFISH